MTQFDTNWSETTQKQEQRQRQLDKWIINPTKKSSLFILIGLLLVTRQIDRWRKACCSVSEWRRPPPTWTNFSPFFILCPLTWVTTDSDFYWLGSLLLTCEGSAAASAASSLATGLVPSGSDFVLHALNTALILLMRNATCPLSKKARLGRLKLNLFPQLDLFTQFWDLLIRELGSISLQWPVLVAMA